MKQILTIITVATMILIRPSAPVSAAETVSSAGITDELIVRKLKTLDRSLAISVETVLYQLKRHRPLILVDVRRQQDFERLHIPGSINIPLYAVKIKSYLKTVRVVLVNQGINYAELQAECLRLGENGFTASILDGGLPAWKRNGGQLIGDLFALEDLKTISSRAFFRAKDNQNTVVVDISSTRSDASTRLFPYANHIPIGREADGSIPELKRLNQKTKPFEAVVILSETGNQYERAEAMLNKMGIDAFYLRGGVAAYQKFIAGLVMSWKSRDSRLKTIGNCQPCGEINEYDSDGSGIVRKE